MSRVLVYDPSGNHKEGDGITGYAVFEHGKLACFGSVHSANYTCAEEYWDAVADLIFDNKSDVVVCESYKLFGHKAKQQSWSELETPQLIGVIRWRCWHDGVKLVFQDPACKPRVADPILEHMGIIEKRGQIYYCRGSKTNLHQRDAIRHGVYFFRYGVKEK